MRFAPISLAVDFDGRFQAAALQPGMARSAAYVNDGTGRPSQHCKTPAVNQRFSNSGRPCLQF